MKFVVIMLTAVLAACSHLHPNIRNAPLHDLAYTEAVVDVKNKKDAPVRWGGVIIAIDNQQNASFVQVLYYPLGTWGRPQIGENPLGRFVFKTSEFLDPVIYSVNRLVTVAGTLSGTVERKVGERTLSLPLVNVSTVHLWPHRADGFYERDRMGFGFGFGFHPYSIMRHPYHWWPHHRLYGPLL